MPALTRLATRGLAAAITLALAGLGWRPAAAQPPVWLARGPHASVVLFGSVHLLPPGLGWEPPALQAALSHADEVWFEIPIDPADDLAAQRTALADGLQPDGQRLSDALGAADRRRLAEAAAACGLQVEALERLRPWLADVTLSLESYRRAGAEADDGVERRLAVQVPPTAQHKAFETPAGQIAMLADAPLADQLASLRETLGEVKTGPGLYERLLRAWLDGDEGAIVREALRPMMREAPGVYQVMVVDRNRRWEQVLRARLAGEGHAVVVVGVGHLVGPESLPALLRKDGLEVTRIDPQSGAPIH